MFFKKLNLNLNFKLNLKLKFKLNIKLNMLVSHAESSYAAFYVTCMPQKKICKISEAPAAAALPL